MLDRRSIPLYIAFQTLALAFCWGWFAGWWAVAFLQYSMSNLEWWVLVATACAGLYGLRPNLEKAIDTAWLHGISNSKVLAERAGQLRPIKRRIDLIFSAVVLVVVVVLTILWFGGTLNVSPV